jgi:hypothetical protein
MISVHQRGSAISDKALGLWLFVRQSCPYTAHQRDGKSGERSQNRDWCGHSVGQSHVRPRMVEGAHDEQHKAEKSHGDEKANYARDEGDYRAEKQSPHENIGPGPLV